MTSSAQVSTAAGRRYLQQLCKHWGHKFPADFTPEHGEIDLPLGRCLLDADDVHLIVRLEPKPDADLDRLEAVVVEHLQRFAFREQLEFRWERGDAAD